MEITLLSKSDYLRLLKSLQRFNLYDSAIGDDSNCMFTVFCRPPENVEYYFTDQGRDRASSYIAELKAKQFGKPEDGYRKCFYLGEFAYAEEPKLNDKYYLFDCLDADLDGLHEASEFDSDAEAIKVAADHEAALYSREYVDGVYEESKVLYEPLFG